jgi:hypothetical protein
MIKFEIIHVFFWAGMSLPGPHVEESWQSAEYYNNKVRPWSVAQWFECPFQKLI